MSETQIPAGPAHLDCPLHKKPMSKVCNRCPLWVKLRGKHPQYDSVEVDEWNCSLAWLPMLLIENAQQQRQTGAAVESFRNEVVEETKVPRLLALTKALSGGGLPDRSGAPLLKKPEE